MMYCIKGFEFQYVFLVGINEGVVLEIKVLVFDDFVEQCDVLFNECVLLYVVVICVVKGLFVLLFGIFSLLLVVD